MKTIAYDGPHGRMSVPGSPGIEVDRDEPVEVEDHVKLPTGWREVEGKKSTNKRAKEVSGNG